MVQLMAWALLLAPSLRKSIRKMDLIVVQICTASHNQRKGESKINRSAYNKACMQHPPAGYIGADLSHIDHTHIKIAV